jgi:hypothetical protein
VTIESASVWNCASASKKEKGVGLSVEAKDAKSALSRINSSFSCLVPLQKTKAGAAKAAPAEVLLERIRLQR